MSLSGLLTLTSVLLGVLILTPPLGSFIHAAMEGRPTRLTPIASIAALYVLQYFQGILPLNLVTGTVVIVGARSCFAALGLGPIAEQLILRAGQTPA